MSSFWERKMGGAAPPPGQSQQRPYDPNMPPGMSGDRQQAVNHYVSHLPAFQNGGVAPAAPAPPGAPEPPQGPPTNMEQALAYAETRGDLRGAAALDNIGNCPACGSFRYMQRTSGAVTTVNGVMPPKPQCFDCGYPSEQGVIAKAAIVTQTGPAAPAKQGAMMPFMGLAGLQKG